MEECLEKVPQNQKDVTKKIEGNKKEDLKVAAVTCGGEVDSNSLLID